MEDNTVSRECISSIELQLSSALINFTSSLTEMEIVFTSLETYID